MRFRVTDCLRPQYVCWIESSPGLKSYCAGGGSHGFPSRALRRSYAGGRRRDAALVSLVDGGVISSELRTSQLKNGRRLADVAVG